MYKFLTSVHPFLAQLTLLSSPQNPMLYNTFQSTRHLKVPLPVVASTSPCNTFSLDSPDSAFGTASRYNMH